MISTARLIEGMVGDWVAFDRWGETFEVDIPGSIGPAALLVSPLTDALKLVAGGVVESVDRDQMWQVEAMVLNRVVLRRLSGDEMSVEELMRAVRELRFRWQISPVAAPLRAQ
ncbi:MAG TPA: hypothetical protein VMM14_00505 [Acidimicrobiia bacterium]|nr:hypothetical protein [Acidimicrobiia bacterium]